MHPNFTGEWRLIRGESDFGFLPPPSLRVDTIVHQDPQLHIRTRQTDANGDLTVDRDLIIGGAAETIDIRGRTRSTRAFWEDDVLVIEIASVVSGKSRRIEDRWSLDPATDRVTIARLWEQPGGAVHQKLVLRRVPA